MTARAAYLKMAADGLITTART
jgi:hypothetical protein